MTGFRRGLVAAALALTAVIGSASGASAQTSLVLGTASVGGTYYV